MTTLLDPTSERSPVARPRLARPDALDGKIVGLLDISKPRGDVFLDRIHELLSDRGIEVKRYMKPTVARPAPVPLAQQIGAEVNLVIEGLAD
ncbi:MAG: hypothetical protein EXR05_07200 [Acetobacteraceae bacterium]|nr:hypothetical protein [Acetobacteraceae bacterium]